MATYFSLMEADPFTCSWQYVSYGVPDQLREVSEGMFEHEREKAAERIAEAYTEVRQVLR